MKKNYWWMILLLLVTACNSGVATQTTPAQSTLDNLPAPQVYVTEAPYSRAAAEGFLNAWVAEDYNQMYAYLTPLSQDAISLDDFIALYKDTIVNLSMIEMDYEILSTLTNPKTGQVAYRVTYNTSLLGEIARDMVMNLSLENGGWMIQWEDAMILPELKGGNRLAMDVKIPSRGNIYDSEGNTLVAQSDAIALGIIPEQVPDGQEGRLFDELAKLTGKTWESIQALYEDNYGINWYVPVGEATLQDIQNRYEILTGLGGLVMNDFSSRFYFDGGVAPHVTGYVQTIYKEDLEEYQRKGYRGDEKVCAAGLESWGEEFLSGTRGASLYVVDPKGQIVTRIAQSSSLPSMSIYTTLDKEFQADVQLAMSGFKGSIVVMERDTGRILAMASSPTFDPNVFEPQNYNSSWQLEDVVLSDDRPLVNRVTQGGYPLGSVFKIITMAAALESGLYTEDTVYDCQHEFTELPDLVLYDWTYEKEVAPSGELTLPQGLMRSCNPYFWHIGLDLFRQNLPNAVTDMALAFGLGNPTGIGHLDEDSGNMPYPNNEGDAVQQAIGQGAMLVTPLQVVKFIAAIGNGGTLYRPQVVEKVVSPNGEEIEVFEPEAMGTLPISDETLRIVRDGMRSVVADPRGTAQRTFLSLNYPVYGKTGTAENPIGDSHAWFAGYTDANREDKPDIAIVVIAENAGEGSEIGAPIFRRVVELYFEGKASRLYWWEASLNVTITPTPLNTNTPFPQDTPTPNPEEETE